MPQKKTTGIPIMTEERYQEILAETKANYGGTPHALEVYDVNGVKNYLFSFREQTGHTMFMGNHTYKYKYKYRLFKGEAYKGEASMKNNLINTKLYKVVERYI